MDWEIVWTEPALENLEAILTSSARHSEAAAESLRVAILDSVAALARFPEIGPVYERDRTGRTREIVCRQYRIFYQLDEADRKVVIVLLWHASRREPRLPR